MSSQTSLSQFVRFVRRHAWRVGLIVFVTGAVAVTPVSYTHLTLPTKA